MLESEAVKKVCLESYLSGENLLCSVFGVLASLLLKQILLYDVGYNVPTFWHGSVCLVFVAWFSRALSF